jgi:predicted Rossmann-fold nucleotide-binding protein
MKKIESQERGGMENERENRRKFRVAIFGTGREGSEQDEEAMRNAGLVAGLAIEQGFSVATGGYNKGAMRSASEAAVKKAMELGIEDTSEVVKAFPLSERLKGEIVSGAEIVRSDMLVERLEYLINKSDAFVVVGGKIGTILELISALHSEKIQKKMRDKGSAAKPIIIIDPSMEHTDLLSLLAKRDKKFRSDKTLNEVYVLSHTPDLENQAREILDLYYKEGKGEKMSEAERSRLDKINLKNFLDSQEHFAAGAGI